MDLKMQAEDIQSTGITWDCEVDGGIVPIISDDKEDLQAATIAAFLIKGTVPQLPEAGVPWIDFLTKKITFGELDFYIRESLHKTDKDAFFPEYGIEKDKLTMKVGKLKTEDISV